jgi:hypothetical protein
MDRHGLEPVAGMCRNPQRIEPPTSEPSSKPVKPAASAAADPPEDPPGERAVFHGLLVVP